MNSLTKRISEEIPMGGVGNSLNVAVATSLVLYRIAMTIQRLITDPNRATINGPRTDGES